ncbi:MAG: Gfo/Idh/MocA family oxidoreductase [Verrucomicrobiales bacterium]|nr:Gfo/Idh/MocA family oxidoreductase [Verrucomicrobiales bacterium]
MKTREPISPISLPKTQSSISRRQFLGGTAFSVAAFQIVPGSVLGLNGAAAPSERLNIAGIGIGGQGASDLNQLTSENIVALCDVDWKYAAGVFKKYPNAKQYKDYRKMLDEQRNIDAVVVATPDHTHAFASTAAMKMGKHVYCEKPLTHSVWEARQLAQFARQHNVATQMGNQGQASEGTRRLCEMVWDGAIGSVREAHIWTDRPSNGLFNEYWPQGIGRPEGSPPVPDTLEWDLWLGPAPSRPYHPAYAPFKWRGWWDFGTGALGDIGCHTFDPVFRALKLTHPVSVEATSTRVNEETFPLASMVTYHFSARGEMPPLKLVWYDGGLRPPRPEELEAGREMGSNGHLLIGDRGKILASGGGRGNFQLIPESRRKEYGDAPKKLERSIGHYKEWIEACKGGKPGGSNFDWAGPLTEVVLLGNVALRLKLREELTKKKLLWDAPNMRFTNSAEANKFLRREYREGWKLG